MFHASVNSDILKSDVNKSHVSVEIFKTNDHGNLMNDFRQKI